MNWNLPSKIILQGVDNSQFFSGIDIIQNYGINPIMAGVMVGYNQTQNYNFPIFNSVAEIITELGEVTTSIIFSNPLKVLDATLEAIESNIKQIIINTHNIPPLDFWQILEQAKAKNVQILGGGNAGIIIPDKLCLGLVETEFYQVGNIAIINSGDWSLNYEVALQLNQNNYGVSIAINLGSNDVINTNFLSWLQLLENDQNTEVIILIISQEKYLIKDEFEGFINYYSTELKKPIIFYMPDYNSNNLGIIKNNNTMIADRVPSFLNQVLTREEIINQLSLTKIKVANSFTEIYKMI